MECLKDPYVGCSLEWESRPTVIIRWGEEHLREPFNYDNSCYGVVIGEGVLEVKGLDTAITPSIWKAIERECCRAGIHTLVFDRHSTGEHRRRTKVINCGRYHKGS